jgi:hypothetical protein
MPSLYVPWANVQPFKATIDINASPNRIGVTTLTGLPSPIVCDLNRLVESEEFGFSLFETAAKLTRSDRTQAAWSALRELEKQTNAGVAAFIARSGLALEPTNAVARAVGSSGGTGMQLLPYRLQLRTFGLVSKRYLPAFHRLARHYEGTEEAAFFNYVLRHELAIIEFASNALADARAPLDPVLRLLDAGVPGLTTESC